jgi:hypothetical protein
MSETESQTETTPQFDPGAIFQQDGPVDPSFINEAVRTLMRALPLGDPDEPTASGFRRMSSALIALAALRPRDETEVLLGIQAISAYHAAAACWRLGMNHHLPRGDSTRHINTAASAARTFDTLLKALERRQAKPLPQPKDRPAPRCWAKTRPTQFMQLWEQRCGTDADADPDPATAAATAEWTPEALVIANDLIERERIEEENRGLDIANTEGILPDGSIIMPEDPTPQQEAYIARRLGLAYKREYAENLRNGIKKLPKIRPLRTGDHVR